MNNRMSPYVVGICVVVLLGLIVTPAFIGNYWLRVLTAVFMYVVVAQGLNIIVGFAGYHAFGNSAFFGVGAYATGVAMSLGVPFAVTVPLSALVAALAAGVLGWPLLRLRGHYFAIATVALNMAMTEVIINIGGITGGAQGLPLPISPLPPDTLFRIIYFLMLGALVAATGTVWWLSRSRMGYALRALKDSEAGAEVMGIHTVRMKVVAWMLSAGFTGLVGGIWAYWMTFIEVSSAFDIGISVRGYVMMLLGGMGTVFGPLVGAVFFELLATLIWSEFTNIHNMLLGLLVIVVVMLLPRGIAAYWDRLLAPMLQPRVAGKSQP